MSGRAGGGGEAVGEGLLRPWNRGTEARVTPPGCLGRSRRGPGTVRQPGERQWPVPTSHLAGPLPCLTPQRSPQPCRGSGIANIASRRGERAQEGPGRAGQPRGPELSHHCRHGMRGSVGSPPGQARPLRSPWLSPAEAGRFWEPSGPGFAGPVGSQSRRLPNVSSQGSPKAFGFSSDARAWPPRKAASRPGQGHRDNPPSLASRAGPQPPSVHRARQPITLPPPSSPLPLESPREVFPRQFSPILCLRPRGPRGD